MAHELLGLSREALGPRQRRRRLVRSGSSAHAARVAALRAFPKGKDFLPRAKGTSHLQGNRQPAETHLWSSPC